MSRYKIARMRQLEIKNPGYANSTDIDLVELFHVLWGKRYLFLSVATATLALAIAYALLATPIYRAEVLVSYNSQNPQQDFLSRAGPLGSLVSIAGLGGGGDNGVDVAIATLESRKFLTQFIASKTLMPILFSDEWDAKAKRWNVDVLEDAPSEQDAFDLFTDDILGVYRDEKTGLITVSVEWTDAKTAAGWANDLVRQLNALMKATKLAESQKNLEYLNNELKKMTVAEIRNSIFQLLEEEIKASMIARNRDEFAFKVIDPATPPDRAVKPLKILVAFAGMMLGGLLGLLAVFIRHRIEGTKS